MKRLAAFSGGPLTGALHVTESTPEFIYWPVESPTPQLYHDGDRPTLLPDVQHRYRRSSIGSGRDEQIAYYDYEGIVR